eukprot:COSAG06_NODE_41623_length_389_cov_1.072414_1_plen_49_part_10
MVSSPRACSARATSASSCAATIRGARVAWHDYTYDSYTMFYCAQIAGSR